MAKAELGRSIQTATTKGIEFFLRHYNGLEITMDPNVPRNAPVLVLINHGSIFDMLAGMVADPYRPRTVPVVKDEISHIPVIKQFLSLWNPIYVKRDGSDVFATWSKIKKVLLKEQRAVCIAVEGTRSRSGHMEGLHPLVVRMVLDFAGQGVPVVPCGIDAYGVLPPGSKIPERRKISVHVGRPMDLEPWAERRKLTEEEFLDAGKYIQNAIAILLPPERRPLPNSPALRDLNQTRRER